MIFLSLYQVLFVLVPILLIACFRKSSQPLKVIPVLFLILLVDNVSVYSGMYFSISSLNWQGKIQEILWPLLVVYVFKWQGEKEVGYCIPEKKIDWLWGVILGLFIAAVGLLHESQSGEKSSERFIFQLLIPGMAEEPVFRGVVLAFLNRYFERSWNVFKVKLGWGVFLSAILFSAVHVVVYSFKSTEIVWNWSSLPLTLFAGCVFGWLREKSKSVWPCILSHNLANIFS